jgi:deoxycytidylate deaminase
MHIPNLLYRYALANQPVANARVVAAICHRKELLALGCNRYKTHPLQARYGRNAESIYLHAEIDAISRWERERRDYREDRARQLSIYILRIKRNSPKGNFILGMAKPCVGCMKAIVAFNILNICYSTDVETMTWI